MVFFFCVFSIFSLLIFLLILAGVQYDTARSLSKGWAGLPNHPSLIQQQSQAEEGPGPGLGLSPSWSGAFQLVPQPNFYLYKASLTCIICEDTKSMIVRPASSLVGFFSSYLQKWLWRTVVQVQPLRHGLFICALWKKTLRSLNCDLKQVAAVT